MTDNLSSLAELLLSEDIKVPNLYETYESIADAVAKGHIRAVVKNGNTVGFFTWKEVIKNNKLYIFIQNMCIKKQYKSKTNLLFLREFFRVYYNKRYEFVYWYNRKKERFYYAA